MKKNLVLSFGIIILVASAFVIISYFGLIRNIAITFAWIVPDKYCVNEKNLLTYEISDYDSGRSVDPTQIRGVFIDKYDSISESYESYAEPSQAGWSIIWIYEPTKKGNHELEFQIEYPSLGFTSVFGLPINVVDCSEYSCTNECTAGVQTCDIGVQRQCGNFDSDPCTEWGNEVTCEYGCDGNACAYAPDDCLDECSFFGQTRCYSSIMEQCGNYDKDSCLEWGLGTSCSYGCDVNECASAPSTENIVGTPCGEYPCDNSYCCSDENTRAFTVCEINYVSGEDYDGYYDRYTTEHQTCAYGCRDGFCQADPGSPLAEIQNILISVSNTLSLIVPRI